MMLRFQIISSNKWPRALLITGLVLAVLAPAGESAAVKLGYGIGGGASHAIGDSGDLWRTGFEIGGGVPVPVKQYIFVGGRVGYSFWDIDELEALKAAVPPDAVDVFPQSATGSADILSVTAIARLSTGRDLGILRGHLQVGGGLYFTNLDADVRASYNLDGSGVPTESAQFVVDQRETNAGINVGGGFSIRFSQHGAFDGFFLFNQIFAEQKIEYITAGFGFSFIVD
jgi:hypothetical protein